MKYAINQRLEKYFHEKKIKPADIVEKTGVSKQTISNVLNSKVVPGGDTLEAIFKGYPDLNPTWVMIEEESMIRGKETPPPDLKDEFIEHLKTSNKFMETVIKSKMFQEFQDKEENDKVKKGSNFKVGSIKKSPGTKVKKLPVHTTLRIA